MLKKLGIALLSFTVVLGALFISNYNPSNAPLPEKIIPPVQRTVADALKTISSDEITRNLNFLCDDAQEGRMSGMKGNERCADYIVNLFGNYGLEPVNSGWKQEFPVEKMNEYKEKSSGKTANIIAFLPGKDLKNETIVIGAHMDHIGYGPRMSQTPNRREIHNGADDNASGTVCMLAQAKAWGFYRQNRRNLVFIAFSGEEMGLIGSQYYVKNPTHTNIVLMVNHDMVGRYRNQGKVSCLGAGNSPEICSALEKIKGTYPFRPVTSTGSGGGSDHVPFYQKRIPICFFHTGGHADYHTPDDDANKIDVDGVAMIAKFSFEMVNELDKQERKPSFQGTVKIETKFKDH